MKYKMIIVIVAILSVGMIEVTALILGHNGYMHLTALSTIFYLVGRTVGKGLDKNT
jgi:hypothetical protein